MSWSMGEVGRPSRRTVPLVERVFILICVVGSYKVSKNVQVRAHSQIRRRICSLRLVSHCGCDIIPHRASRPLFYLNRPLYLLPRRGSVSLRSESSPMPAKAAGRVKRPHSTKGAERDHNGEAPT